MTTFHWRRPGAFKSAISDAGITRRPPCFLRSADSRASFAVATARTSARLLGGALQNVSDYHCPRFDVLDVLVRFGILVAHHRHSGAKGIRSSSSRLMPPPPSFS